MARRLRAARAGAQAPAARRRRTRALVIGAVLAAVVGFAAGWLVRRLAERTPEERARAKVGEIRERAHELTR